MLSPLLSALLLQSAPATCPAQDASLPAALAPWRAPAAPGATLQPGRYTLALSRTQAPSVRLLVIRR